MEKFEVKGNFKAKGKECKFCKQLEANSESRAKDMVLSLLGSAHKLTRRHINIEEVKKMEKET